MRRKLILLFSLALAASVEAQQPTPAPALAPPAVFDNASAPNLFGGGDLQTALDANAKADPALAAGLAGIARNPDGTITLDLTEQPILTVFRLLAGMAKIDFIAPPLKGDEKITLNLVRVSPREGFERIAKARGFRIVDQGGTLTLERSDVASPQAFITKTYTLREVRVAHVAQALGNLLGIDLTKADVNSPAYPEPVQAGGTVGITDSQARPRFTSGLPMSERLSRAGEVQIFFLRRTNQVIIRATSAQHEQVNALLASLDRDVPQIAMTAYVLEVADTRDQTAGVDWTKTLGPEGIRLGLAANSSAGGTAPIMQLSRALLYQGAVLQISDAEVAVRALRGLQNTRSLGSPNLVLQPGVPSQIVNLQKETIALVNTVSSGNVATQNTSLQTFVTGLSIDVVADLLPNGKIGLNLSPRLSSRTGATQTAIGNIPTTSERGTTADVIIPDGSAIVLGGILSASESDGTAEVPMLGRIPVLGFLFKSRSKAAQRTNLVIVVTARTLHTPSRQRFNAETENFLRATTADQPGEPAYRYSAEPGMVPPPGPTQVVPAAPVGDGKAVRRRRP